MSEWPFLKTEVTTGDLGPLFLFLPHKIPSRDVVCMPPLPKLTACPLMFVPGCFLLLRNGSRSFSVSFWTSSSS